MPGQALASAPSSLAVASSVAASPDEFPAEAARAGAVEAAEAALPSAPFLGASAQEARLSSPAQVLAQVYRQACQP